MSTARDVRHIMYLVERYAKAKATGRNPSVQNYRREAIKAALIPIIKAAELTREVLNDE